MQNAKGNCPLPFANYFLLIAICPLLFTNSPLSSENRRQQIPRFRE